MGEIRRKFEGKQIALPIIQAGKSDKQGTVLFLMSNEDFGHGFIDCLIQCELQRQVVALAAIEIVDGVACNAK